MHDMRPFGLTLRFAAAAAALIACPNAIAAPAERDQAAAAASPAAEPSPFFGVWELDVSRLPDSYGPPPKSVRYTFEDAGSGQWRTRVEIIGRDDSVRRISAVYRRDGRAVRGEGDDSEADTVAVSAPAPNVLFFNLAKNNHPAGMRTYVVSTDGQEMTESAGYLDSSGVPLVRSFHFRRIR